MASAQSILVPKLVNRGFKVVQPLASASGHATVYRVAENEEAPDAYVAKVVSLTGLDAKDRASAQQEVSLLKGLASHPNLIAYKESWLEEAGMLYIVMSLAEDGDLRCVVTESIEAKRVLPEEVVLSWLRQTLSGLRHLHSQGVVHRDLKSSNIFLCEGRRRIRIGDFGISRVLESTAFASSCVGTPAYMSPELMRNERYDYHVDMWALGCICFELCTLNLPFAARSLMELALQVLNADPAWSMWSGYSDELRDVAHRLLTKDVTIRPSAEDLLGEPLFTHGRASQDPSDEVWATLARPGAADRGSPQEKRGHQPPMSQLTTAMGSAIGSSKGLSSKGNDSGQWASTPRAPWEGSSTGASASPGGFSPEAPSVAGYSSGAQMDSGEQFTSREEFTKILATHLSSSELAAELRGEGSSVSAAVPGRMPVAESVV